MKVKLNLAVLPAVLVIALPFVLGGCTSRSADATPSIEIESIPPAAEGGRDRMGTISGRVEGARAGQKIVVYAQSGPWWVQPRVETPLIPIRADSTWSTETHFGFQYAALLVDRDYRPPPTLDVAPAQGGSVALVKIVKGAGSAPDLPTKPLEFSGYDWKVRTTSAVRGGEDNLYDGDNVWTDTSGALHLRISKKSDKWTCAHISLTRSLGYGTYILTVRDISHLEPAAILSIHTYDPMGGEWHFREMDFEIGRWGEDGRKYNAQYVVQPFFLPGNITEFTEPSGMLTEALLWEPGRASFKTTRGPIRNDAPVIYEHAFTSGVPTPGQELLQMMFYVVASDKYPLQKDNEVVIDKFEYLP
jgi:hypothetical protein